MHFNVCIIASKGNRRGSHPPDFCLEGGGGSIIVKNTLRLDGVPELGDLACRELVLQRGGQYEYYLYVYRCGSSYTSSWYWQQVVVLGNRLVGNKIGGALVRLSTSARGIADPEARRRLADYMRAVIPYVSQAVQ
jgi:EpsI family protein